MDDDVTLDSWRRKLTVAKIGFNDDKCERGEGTLGMMRGDA